MSTEYRQGYVYPGMSPQAIQDLITYIYDTTYPVGSYYETTDTTFDPNENFVGEWELETEGLVHVSSGSHYAVSANAKDGGEATHTLTAAESGVPAHGHGASSGNGYMSFVRVVGSAGTGYANNHITGYASASYKDVNNTSNFPGAAHTHSITVNQNTAANASSAHNNMQPYKIVNRWHRVA